MSSKLTAQSVDFTFVEQTRAALAGVRLTLPAEAVQLLYDVLGHFPFDRGAWSQANTTASRS